MYLYVQIYIFKNIYSSHFNRISLIDNLQNYSRKAITAKHR